MPYCSEESRAATQHEEVAAELIRGKVAASRRKGRGWPAEQARIVTLLIERIDLRMEGLNVRLRIDGLNDLTREMLPGDMGEAA